MKAFPDFPRMFGFENTVSADSRLSDLSFRLDRDSGSSRGPAEFMIYDLPVCGVRVRGSTASHHGLVLGCLPLDRVELPWQFIADNV